MRLSQVTSGTPRLCGSRPVEVQTSREAARAMMPLAVGNASRLSNSPWTTAARTGPGTAVRADELTEQVQARGDVGSGRAAGRDRRGRRPCRRRRACAAGPDGGRTPEYAGQLVDRVAVEGLGHAHGAGQDRAVEVAVAAQFRRCRYRWPPGIHAARQGCPGGRPVPVTQVGAVPVDGAEGPPRAFSAASATLGRQRGASGSVPHSARTLSAALLPTPPTERSPDQTRASSPIRRIMATRRESDRTCLQRRLQRDPHITHERGVSPRAART